MRFEDWLRSRIKGRLLNEKKLALRAEDLSLPPHFQDIDNCGLYLHIPFCRQICPYCPYNKEIYRLDVVEQYREAVLQEIDHYGELVGSRPVTSFYIGGGTPTTMLDTGLAEIIEYIYRKFNMQCGVHMESHPNDLSAANLNTISVMGVEHLSIGVEALQDHHLGTLHRPYRAIEAKATIERAVTRGFKSVNVDVIFALPNQTHDELKETARALVNIGVDQISAYPIFSFPYTQWPQMTQQNGYRSYNLLQKRHMLQVFEEILYSAGYERTSVWAFTRRGVPKYCSVTVPLYLGLGAGAGSYLRDIFYLNTFNVLEYIRALADGRVPIALSLVLSKRMQMAGWLYWRIYETRFRKDDFQARFGEDLDATYGTYMRLFSMLRLMKEQQGEMVLTDSGAYWLHVLQDLFSIDYVGKLWGTSRDNPWPREVIL